MHVYNIWGQIDSGSLGVMLNILNPPFKWQMQFENGTKGIASLYLNQTNNLLVVYESHHKVQNLEDLSQSVKSVVQSLYDAALLHCGIAARIELTSIMTDENVFGRIQLNDVINCPTIVFT